MLNDVQPVARDIADEKAAAELTTCEEHPGETTARLEEEIKRRTEMEESLRESEQRYMSIFDNVSMGIGLLNPQMEVLSVNRALRKRFPNLDLSRKLLCYQLFCSPPRNQICSPCPAIKTIQDGEVHEEVEEANPGRFIRKVSSPIKDVHGRVVAVVHMTEDVTERELAERSRRESEAKYRDLAELLPGVVFEANLAGRVTFMNQRGFESFGYTREEFEDGIDIMDLLVPEDRDRAAQAIYELLDGEESATHEYTLCRRNGDIFPALVSASPVIRVGRPVGLRGIVTDITQVKQSEMALAESENKFRDLAERAAIGVYLVQGGLFRYVNPSLAKMHGFSPEELVDKKGPEDLVLEEDWPRVKDWFGRTVNTSEDDVIEFRDKNRNGKIIECETHGCLTYYRGAPAAIGTTA